MILSARRSENGSGETRRPTGRTVYRTASFDSKWRVIERLRTPSPSMTGLLLLRQSLGATVDNPQQAKRGAHDPNETRRNSASRKVRPLEPLNARSSR